MSFLSAGCPRGGRSPRSCRIHRKQGASWNHGIIGTQRLQCKPSKWLSMVKVCSWTEIVVFPSQRVTQERRGSKDQLVWQVKEWVLLLQMFTVVIMSNFHKKKQQQCLVRTSVLFSLCSLLVVVGQFFTLSLGSPWKRWRGWACWSTWPTCKFLFICIRMHPVSVLKKLPTLSSLIGCRRWQRRAGTPRCERIPGMELFTLSDIQTDWCERRWNLNLCNKVHTWPHCVFRVYLETKDLLENLANQAMS